MNPPWFIAFEGGEGCGKSTQAAFLAQHLNAVLTREPGGTPLGERIREVLLDPTSGDIDARTEALLLAAARAEHVARVIRPALERGNSVVTDRFSGSSLAYQGYGRGLDLDELRELCEWATGGLWPDLTILLDVPMEEAWARLGPDRDRLESEDAAFHARVVEGFRSLAATDAERWTVVDGTGSIEDVATRVSATFALWVRAREVGDDG